MSTAPHSSLRLRVVGNSIVLGEGLPLARRVFDGQNWAVEEIPPERISHLLSLAYDRDASPGSNLLGAYRYARTMLSTAPAVSDRVLSWMGEPVYAIDMKPSTRDQEPLALSLAGAILAALLQKLPPRDVSRQLKQAGYPNIIGQDAHDVSCEPRDDHGCWTTGGATSERPKDTQQNQGTTGPKVGDTIRGNASFYGNSDPTQGPTDHFAGQRTSEGQIMDPNGMTAAVFPGSVPMGSTVRVALASDPSRYVDVVVNDKGLYRVDKNGNRVPISGNRVIDVSPAAFRRLEDNLKAKPASVTVTIIKLPEGKKK